MKTPEEIKTIVKKAKTIVKEIYSDDKRILKINSENNGVVKESNIVFEKVLEHMLNK